MAKSQLEDNPSDMLSTLLSLLPVWERNGWRVFSRQQLALAVHMTVARLQDITISHIRPGMAETLIGLRGPADRLVEHRLLEKSWLPVPPKRKADHPQWPPSPWCRLPVEHIQRHAGSIIEITGAVTDDIDLASPFSIFRPAAICNAAQIDQRLPRAQRPYLRLVVDNTREVRP